MTLSNGRLRGLRIALLATALIGGIFHLVRSVAELVERLTPEWRRFLDAVVAMGYRLVITEFDVRDRRLPADIATRDAGVAEFARGFSTLWSPIPG